MLDCKNRDRFDRGDAKFLEIIEIFRSGNASGLMRRLLPACDSAIANLQPRL
jgi:hypothetical protein